MFEALETLEAWMSDGRSFLFGEQLTENDIRLFVTLIWFDAAYHGLFKTNLKRIADYTCLQRFVERMLAVPGVAETVSVDHIKAGYYLTKALNSNGIVPGSPDHITETLSRSQSGAAQMFESKIGTGCYQNEYDAFWLGSDPSCGDAARPSLP